MEKSNNKTHAIRAGDLERLRGLVPMHTLPDELFQLLQQHVQAEDLVKGGVLFNRGDTTHENVYLLQGEIGLFLDDRLIDKIKTDSGTARFPIGHELPRRYTARALGEARCARVDSQHLNDLLAQSSTTDYQVVDLDEGEDDWMTQLLQSRVLQQIPAANIQRVMLSVERVDVTKDEDLIRQGDPGDYYYMLTRGEAVVRRDRGDGSPPVDLAVLGPGDAFGEEALLSDRPRNSTVTMRSDGQVLRLSKDNFIDLIRKPLSEKIDLAAAQQRIEAGSVWLDLRPKNEFTARHLPNSLNLPFDSLRYDATGLAHDKRYVLFGQSEGSANVAAYLLTEWGFDVAVLAGGHPDLAADSSATEVADAVVADTTVTSADSAADDIAKSSEAAVAADYEELQGRLREAEGRASELEHRLHAAREEKVAHASVLSRQQLASVRDTVEMAKRKLLAAERQKREAQQAQEAAWAEVKRLTEAVDTLKRERDTANERAGTIERDLSGATDLAETAQAKANTLQDQFTELQAQRARELDAHERARGALKEEITELRMLLDDAKARHAVTTDDAPREDAPVLHDELAAARKQLTALEEANGTLHDDLTRLRSEFDRQRADREADEAVQSAQRQAELDGLHGELTEATTRVDRLQVDNESLRAELDQARCARDDLARDVAAATEGAPAVEELRTELDAVRAEKAHLQEQLAQRQGEVVKLRTVLEKYIDRIKASQAEDSQLQAVHNELVMVREQAGQDIARMRAELDLAESQLKEFTGAGSGSDDPLEREAMRQQLQALGESMSERQRELSAASDSRQMLEDALEDANAEIDRLRRELDKLGVDVEEADYQRREAEEAREQVQAALKKIQTNTEQEKVADLRDERLQRFGGALDIQRVAGGATLRPWLLGGVIGAVAAVLLLLAVVMLSGQGGALLG